MKKIILLISLFLLNLDIIYATDIRDGMLPNSGVINDSGDGIDMLNTVLVYAKDLLIVILAVIVIGAFLYLGFKLVISRGNPEELKKSLLGFVYIVVGMAAISLAWALVRVISSLNF